MYTILENDDGEEGCIAECNSCDGGGSVGGWNVGPCETAGGCSCERCGGTGRVRLACAGCEKPADLFDGVEPVCWDCFMANMMEGHEMMRAETRAA